MSVSFAGQLRPTELHFKARKFAKFAPQRARMSRARAGRVDPPMAN
jgi:hypothetical protein